MYQINILSDELINDKKSVKEYLEYAFRIRRSKKNTQIYLNLCKIYEIYPNTIHQILDNIPKLGYFKDYFFLLFFSKNENMNQYIYNIIVKTMTNDINNLASGKEISTLGKWLPREKSSINKQCNFIDKFNKMFFPEIKNKIEARRQYRKLKACINEKLGTIETKICAKQYDLIEYDKAAPYALKKSQRFLKKHDECLFHLDNYETKLLSQLTLSEFTKEIFLNKHNMIKMINTWNQNIFIQSLPFIDNLQNTICIADLSSDTYNKNGEFFTIGMLLLVNQISNLDKKIIIGNQMITLDNLDIYENAKNISKYIGFCDHIDVVKSYNLGVKENPIDSIIDCLIFVSVKNIIFNIEYLKTNNIKMLHFIPCHNTYDVKYFDGSKIFIQSGCKHNKRDNSEPNKNFISKITSQSHELKDTKRFYLSYIFTLTIIFAFLFLLTYWLI